VANTMAAKAWKFTAGRAGKNQLLERPKESGRAENFESGYVSKKCIKRF